MHPQLSTGVVALCGLLSLSTASAAPSKRAVAPLGIFGHTSLTVMDERSGRAIEEDTGMPFSPELSSKLERGHTNPLGRKMYLAPVSRVRTVCETNSSGTFAVTYGYGLRKEYTYLLDKRATNCKPGPLLSAHLFQFDRARAVHVYVSPNISGEHAAMFLNRVESLLKPPLKLDANRRHFRVIRDVRAPGNHIVFAHQLQTLAKTSQQISAQRAIRVSSSGLTRDFLSALPLDYKLTESFGVELTFNKSTARSAPRIELTCQLDASGKTWMSYDRVTGRGTKTPVNRWESACKPGPYVVATLMELKGGSAPSGNSYALFKAPNVSRDEAEKLIVERVLR